MATTASLSRVRPDCTEPLHEHGILSVEGLALGSSLGDSGACMAAQTVLRHRRERTSHALKLRCAAHTMRYLVGSYALAA